MNFSFQAGEFMENCRQISPNFDGEFCPANFCALFQPPPQKITPKIHARNCRSCTFMGCLPSKQSPFKTAHRAKVHEEVLGCLSSIGRVGRKGCSLRERIFASKRSTLQLQSQGTQYRGQNWKIGKMTLMGSKMLRTVCNGAGPI